MKIQVECLHKSYKIDEALLKKIIGEILKFVKRPQALKLEVFFLDDARIEELNKRYKDKARPTDVLSFGIEAKESGEEALLGEIFISIDRARENSRSFGTRFEEEIVLYVIHGILHLCGYDDESVKARRAMEKRQEEALEYLCERIDLSKVLTRR